MTADHGFQLLAGLLLIAAASDTAAAPGYLFPNEEAQRVTEMEHIVGLRIMAQPDEIGSHLFDEEEFAQYLLFAHGCSHAAMVFMAVGAIEQQTAAV